MRGMDIVISIMTTRNEFPSLSIRSEMKIINIINLQSKEVPKGSDWSGQLQV